MSEYVMIEIMLMEHLTCCILSARRNWIDIGRNLGQIKRSYSHRRPQACTGTAFSTCSADQTKQRPGPGTGLRSEIFVQIQPHVVAKFRIGLLRKHIDVASVTSCIRWVLVVLTYEISFVLVQYGVHFYYSIHWVALDRIKWRSIKMSLLWKKEFN